MLAASVLILFLGFAAGPVSDFATAAAVSLLDGSAYRAAVSSAGSLPAVGEGAP